MLAVIFRIKYNLPPLFLNVEPKQAQIAPQWSAERTADYLTPVNILGKYDNPGGKKIYAFYLSRDRMSQQMLASPLSSLNKQLNWTDLLIIYRTESQGGSCFCWRQGLNLCLTERFCVSTTGWACKVKHFRFVVVFRLCEMTARRLHLVASCVCLCHRCSGGKAMRGGVMTRDAPRVLALQTLLIKDRLSGIEMLLNPPKFKNME